MHATDYFVLNFGIDLLRSKNKNAKWKGKMVYVVRSWWRGEQHLMFEMGVYIGANMWKDLSHIICHN